MPEKQHTQGPLHGRHRLAWMDQVAYELYRVTGRSQLMQCLWLYDRDVDHQALAKTSERLTTLLFNRLIEPSHWPWARPRWVKPENISSPLQENPHILPRSQLLQWANKHARLPIDPVEGPAWRIAIQRFDDGSSAVSIVGSHLVLDGMGALFAIEAAADGQAIPNTYQTQGTRRWLMGWISDGWQILMDTPRTVRALLQIAKLRQAKSAPDPQKQSAHLNDVDLCEVELPSVAVTIQAKDWDACASRLGGRAHALFPAFVATLAAHLGRRRPSDGAISLLVPIDRRMGLGDERALAIEFRTMTLMPESLSKDLRPVNTALKALLRSAKEDQTNALSSMFPAIAWMPRRVATAIVNQMFTYADDLPVSCSNLGTLTDGLRRIDGEPCARVLTRAVDVNVSRRDLARSHGHLVVVGSRCDQTVSLCIEAYQLQNAPTTLDELRQLTERTLNDFGLEAIIEV